MQPFDLVIRGGTVATATDSFKADVGIRGAKIAAIGEGLDKGKKEIDARGKLVLPGGVDSHSHIEQLSASGLMNADTFESATTAAAFGGTTTVISFRRAARRHEPEDRGRRVSPVSPSAARWSTTRST